MTSRPTISTIRCKMNDLNNKYGKEPWFHSVDADQFGNLVVYAKYLNSEVLQSVPDTFGGKKVLLHFAAHKEAKPTTYVSPAAQSSFWSSMKAGINLNPQNFETHKLNDDLDGEPYLTEKLWELRRICGADNLADIFFEIHDGEDAITDLSKEFPSVRKAMEELYEIYGFDVLFNEVERD
jgi:hypothetical protein